MLTASVTAFRNVRTALHKKPITSHGQVLNVKYWLIHSELIDEDYEVFDEPEWQGGKLVCIGTVIAAKSVTLPKTKYAFVHSHVRDSIVHPSGIHRLANEVVPDETMLQMAGRVARTEAGMVTFFGWCNTFDEGMAQLLKQYGPLPSSSHMAFSGLRPRCSNEHNYALHASLHSMTQLSKRHNDERYFFHGNPYDFQTELADAVTEHVTFLGNLCKAGMKWLCGYSRAR